MLSKFSLPYEPPLSLGASPARPLHGPPALGGPSPPGIREATERPPEKSQKVTANAEPCWGRSSRRRRAAFQSERREPSRQGEEAAGGGRRRRCPGRGAGRDRRRRRRAARSPKLRAESRRAAAGLRRGAASPGFRQAAPSRAPGRKEACLRAGKGRGAAGGASSPPK